MSKSNYKKTDINSLILAAQKADGQALEELVKRIQKSVFTMFSYLVDKREDIADLTQDALIKMAKNIGSLKDPKLFKAWLNQIVTNVFYDYVKKYSKDKNRESYSRRIGSGKEGSKNSNSFSIGNVFS